MNETITKVTKNYGGKIFGHLLVKQPSHKIQTYTPSGVRINTRVFWVCECLICRKEVTVRQDNLVSGNTTSCGCLREIYRNDIKDLGGPIASHKVIDVKTNIVYQSLGEYAKENNISNACATYRKRKGYVVKVT